MNKTILINGEEFNVRKDEFEKVPHLEFNNLEILDSLGLFERLVSLTCELTLLFDCKPSIAFHNISHGGYIPLKCVEKFRNLFLYNSSDTHVPNIIANVYRYNTSNISIVCSSILKDIQRPHEIHFIYGTNDIININPDESIIISPKHIFDGKYTLSNTNFTLSIPSKLQARFTDEFHYFLEDTLLTYDNLIHYTMIVKNAGDSFEDVLKANLPIIDRWTILDTGSMDNTIEIINRVLVGKKKGKLYQEPFINFRDSRNRCLDLAGKECKFSIMLDDTYIIEGNLRQFLTEVRGDQFSTTFSLFIKSDDVCYSSNRIVKTQFEHRYIYRIHEVISPKNNMNVIIPFIHSNIHDFRCDYMESRTMNRKLYDIEILFEELADEPDNPRPLYYLGQTYNLLKKYDLAYEYYLKRVEHPNHGFLQERIDSCFEAARMSNFNLNKPWEESEQLYLRSFEMDKSRSDALYFIGIHYYQEAEKGIDQYTNYSRAYTFMKTCFDLGYPEHCQYSLKPTLHYFFLPKFLAHLCYIMNDFKIGLECTKTFIRNVRPDGPYKECYTELDATTVKSWNKIFELLIKIPVPKLKLETHKPKTPLLIFIADGGFSKWTGRDILTKGMGGSETFTVEISRHIEKSGKYHVIVFCNCENNDIFEGVEYRKLEEHLSFVVENDIDTCFVSRYSEYLPVAIEGNVKNIYMIAHDLQFTGNVIPLSNKLKKVFSLTEWHTEFLRTMYHSITDFIVDFGYGIDNKYDTEPELDYFSKSTNGRPGPVFIYSSFPIRGLLPLLQMWPKILERYPSAILNIHSDVDGWWVNQMRPEEMQAIKDLLKEYKGSEVYDRSIIYHGWTSKDTLLKSWYNSDICFYPCTFLETFCHTMLEAAVSKTLIITANLGALKNTVGDRGILLDGDFYTPEFQNYALEEVFKTIENKELCRNLIEKNYKWVSTQTWSNRADILLNEYLLKDS